MTDENEMVAMANGGLELTIPMLWNLGVRVTDARPGFAAGIIPIEGTGNHFGAMYAGALFSVGEFLGGVISMSTFDMSSYFPLVKSLTIDFLKPAKTAVRSSMSLDLEEAAKLQSIADETGKAEFQLTAELHDEAGVLVGRTTGTYQIRKIA